MTDLPTPLFFFGESRVVLKEKGVLKGRVHTNGIEILCQALALPVSGYTPSFFSSLLKRGRVAI